MSLTTQVHWKYTGMESSDLWATYFTPVYIPDFSSLWLHPKKVHRTLQATMRCFSCHQNRQYFISSTLWCMGNFRIGYQMVLQGWYRFFQDKLPSHLCNKFSEVERTICLDAPWYKSPYLWKMGYREVTNLCFFGLFADRSPEYRFHFTSVQWKAESRIAATTFSSYLVIIAPTAVLWSSTVTM